MPVTWNSADKHADITLSGGDLTLTKATAGATYRNARSTTGFSSGKKYFELTINVEGASQQLSVGVANSTAQLDNWPGNNGNSVGGYSDVNTNIWISGADVGDVAAAMAAGDVFCIAPDFDNNRIWYRKNAGGNWNNSATADPATNTEGIDISAITGTKYAIGGTLDQNDQATVNFGATAFTGTIPSGFSAWEAVANFDPTYIDYPFPGPQRSPKRRWATKPQRRNVK